ncbi:MAG: prepilin-type N-terminal cleavage/methylation domain-containing protein [Candidatus Sumerlaeia bacterium]|nr:prepilin-type N-terminal cleavage/methylation domain-containing protein [Candidatus Sumerlaeia bacterium]
MFSLKFSGKTHKNHGFTLIELLIVVAIIAILAAIAVPNFLEAQTRSKVSRARADLRTIATALESYAVDHNRYPPTPFFGVTGVLRVVPNNLSTPVAYITTAQMSDPFIDRTLGDFEYPTAPPNNKSPWTPCSSGNCSPYEPTNPTAGWRYYYQSNVDGRRGAGTQAALLQFAVPAQGNWVLASLGPNEVRDVIFGDSANAIVPGLDIYIPYDPTNGTISEGDIIRTQRESQGSINP